MTKTIDTGATAPAAVQPLARMRHLQHLARRFFGALSAEPPRRDDEQWALARLVPGEKRLWVQMSNPDRRHAVEVAQCVAAELGPCASRPVLAAALLHDVGKVASGLGTWSRVVATVAWAVVPDDRVESWLDGSTVQRRFAQYRRHPELGEALLIEAESDPLTAAWAADHHLPESDWRIDRDLGRVLRSCDKD